MRINVSFWDILLGRRRHGGACKLARAIKRQWPSEVPFWVNVGTDQVDVGEHTFLLPAWVSAKIERWDRIGVVWPCSFELTERPNVATLATIGRELQQLETVHV
jgi:ribosomal protein L39E